MLSDNQNQQYHLQTSNPLHNNATSSSPLFSSSSSTSLSSSLPQNTPTTINTTPLSPPITQISPTISHLSGVPVSFNQHNLPPRLLEEGWRRCWSNKQDRMYFYNKRTQQSVWEMPSLNNHHSTINDPFHHNTMGTNHPIEDSTGLNHAKRPHPIEQHQKGPLKKFLLTPSPYWDFSIPANVSLKSPQRYNHHLLHPHPEIEQFRSGMMVKLRSHYQDLCLHREAIDAPSESFNRWLLERKLNHPKHILNDPLLPNDPKGGVSESMFREVMNDIPVRLSRPRRCDDARKMLAKYAEAARSLMEKRGNMLTEGRKKVTWHAQETFSFLQKRGNTTFDDYMDRLAHLKRECQPYINEAAKQSVEGICLKVNTLSCEYSKKIRERHEEMLKKMGCDVEKLQAEALSSSETAYHHSSTTTTTHACAPLFLAIPPPPPTPLVELQEVNEVVYLKANLPSGSDIVHINITHFQKLEQLYHISSRHDPSMSHFLSRTWCMLKRYNCFFGMKENEGFGLQGALPLSVFACLHRVFEVTFECFASPLNCYFKQYCSVFPDTDGYFGSRGPILDFHPKTGSFEANPPFSEELMDAMVDHFESLLSESEEPLSFIVFVPDWKDPPTEALMKLEYSRYKRHQVTIPGMDHTYRHGFQHVCSKKDMDVKSVHGTTVIFLQNEAGSIKWNVTSGKVKELVVAYQFNE